jgi:hypothetical protein
MVTALLRNKRLMPATVVVLAFIVAALVVALLGGTTTELAFAFAGGIGVSAVVFGVYKLGRRFGHPHSHAVAEAAVAFGVLYFGALVFRLLTTFSP